MICLGIFWQLTVKPVQVELLSELLHPIAD